MVAIGGLKPIGADLKGVQAIIRKKETGEEDRGSEGRKHEKRPKVKEPSHEELPEGEGKRMRENEERGIERGGSYYGEEEMGGRKK